MIKLKVVMSESFNENSGEFEANETISIELEHSLASLSKWEEIWEVPLLSTVDKTEEQNISYLQCMCLTPDVAPEVFYHLSEEQQIEISDFLDKQHTATWFSNEPPASKSGESITAELLYYWMSGFQIDWQAQYWNLNKLLTLIKVHSLKADNKPRQQSYRSRQSEIARINAQRRKELGSNG